MRRSWRRPQPQPRLRVSSCARPTRELAAQPGGSRHEILATTEEARIEANGKAASDHPAVADHRLSVGQADSAGGEGHARRRSRAPQNQGTTRKRAKTPHSSALPPPPQRRKIAQRRWRLTAGQGSAMPRSCAMSFLSLGQVLEQRRGPTVDGNADFSAPQCLLGQKQPYSRVPVK
jgi:hypothetical protein